MNQDSFCALCRDSLELRDSHLLPRALYARFRTPGDGNPNPVVVGSRLAIQTSKQVTDYLLCGLCEQRFNERGERWILANCRQGSEGFPLLDAVAAVDPLFRNPDTEFTVFNADGVAGVSISQVSYFAASVFWRASVHRWRTPLGEPVHIHLGPYQEQLREFLLDKTSCPAHVVLMVAMTRDVITGNFTTFPYLAKRTPEYHLYKFTIPGLSFDLVVGRKIPLDIRALCSTRPPHYPIYLGKNIDAGVEKGIAALVMGSKRKPRRGR